MRQYLTALVLVVVATGAAGQEPMDSAMARFYAARGGQPAWMSGNGVSRQAELLLRLIAGSMRCCINISTATAPGRSIPC
jgi:Scaffold domain